MVNVFLNAWDRIGLNEFLNANPFMRVVPGDAHELVIKGNFRFSARIADGLLIDDQYLLKMQVPLHFPKRMIKVWEYGNRIPTDGKHHTNSDQSLCLGSPLRLRVLMGKDPGLIAFSEMCLVPFLYAISHKNNQPDDGFIMGELPHGEPGIVQDYIDFFRLGDRAQVVSALELASLRRRIANKRPCPCICGRRLGRCELRLKINEVRYYASRSWFRWYSKNLGKPI